MRDTLLQQKAKVFRIWTQKRSWQLLDVPYPGDETNRSSGHLRSDRILKNYTILKGKI